jgi:hypothetical protein
MKRINNLQKTRDELEEKLSQAMTDKIVDIQGLCKMV